MRERGEGEDGPSELEGGREKGGKSWEGEENLAVAMRRKRRRRMPEATAVCAPLSHQMTTVHKSLSLVVQLREAVRDTIKKKKNQNSSKGKKQTERKSDTNARCKYTL